MNTDYLTFAEYTAITQREGDADQSAIEDSIRRQSRFIDAWCGRTFAKTTDDQVTQRLTFGPDRKAYADIREIVAIRYSVNNGASFTEDLDADAYRLGPPGTGLNRSHPSGSS